MSSPNIIDAGKLPTGSLSADPLVIRVPNLELNISLMKGNTLIKWTVLQRYCTSTNREQSREFIKLETVMGYKMHHTYYFDGCTK